MKDYNKESNYMHTCDSKMLDEVYREVFKLGYEQAEKDLGWHSVEESLPKLNEEVIVMWFEYGEVRAEPIRQIAIASLIQPIQCVPMGEKIWTIPGVKYWMPLPKIKQQ